MCTSFIGIIRLLTTVTVQYTTISQRSWVWVPLESGFFLSLVKGPATWHFSFLNYTISSTDYSTPSNSCLEEVATLCIPWTNEWIQKWTPEFILHVTSHLCAVCSTSFCYLYGRFFKVTDALSDGYFTQIITFLLQGRNTMELYVSTSPFVICAQIELDKTAEEFRKNHSERTELLHQWENTIEQMHKRDREMDQLAVVSTTYILYSIVDGPLAITQKYALPMRACPYRQTTQIFAKKTPWPMQYKPHQHGVVVLQWKFLVINVKLSIFILFPNYCEQCNHSNSWQQLLGCWLSTAW